MMWSKSSRDHNATSYSTETKRSRHFRSLPQRAEIITLRAIALKPRMFAFHSACGIAEIITLRAIALKLHASWLDVFARCCRDHNATSYSTETSVWTSSRVKAVSRDHNATSYSTETTPAQRRSPSVRSRDHNATSYSTETECSVNHFAGMCL